MSRLNTGLVGAGGLALGVAATLAITAFMPGASSKDRIEKIVHDYIMENPEILPEAMQALEAKRGQKAIAGNRKAIETPYRNAFAGNPNGDVVVVQFFDYSCGYCRKSVADIDRLIKEDKGVKVVFRELPILGSESVTAAIASLNVADTPRYFAFHDAVYAGGRPSKATLEAAAAKAGLPVSALGGPEPTDAAKAELSKNVDLAQQLGVDGTPAWVIGDTILAGAVGYDAIKQAVDKTRAAKKKS